jgi:hypothetical protein
MSQTESKQALLEASAVAEAIAEEYTSGPDPIEPGIMILAACLLIISTVECSTSEIDATPAQRLDHTVFLLKALGTKAEMQRPRGTA